MFRSARRLLDEFSSKKWYERLPPKHLTVARGFIYYRAKSTAHLRPLKWRTVESNRFLAVGTKRYGHLVAEYNPELTKELSKGKIEGDQVRMFDHRRVWWTCKDCGHNFGRSPKSRQQHQIGCPACRLIPPSETLGAQSLIGQKPLKVTHPNLARQFGKTVSELLASKVVSKSTLLMPFVCLDCGTDVEQTPRAATSHAAYAGDKSAHLAPGVRCATCLWKVAMATGKKNMFS